MILLVFCMIAIFVFSSQNSDKSGNVSEGVTYNIARIFINGFENMTEYEQTKTVENMHFYVRKLAHFSIYALLGFLAFINASFYFVKKKNSILISLLFCFFYATTDEIHQLFSDGRCGSPVDVAIDFSGSLTGVLFVLIVITIFSKVKVKKMNKS